MWLKFPSVFLFFTMCLCFCVSKELELVYQWKELDFNFPTLRDKMYAKTNGLFVPGNAVPIDVDVFHYRNRSDRVFVTIPRFTTGIPATLATVSSSIGQYGPRLDPYPSYSWHSSHGTNCDGITSVFRVFMDECNRLWVVDTGRIDTMQYCAPQILIFDLLTDNLLHRYRFPQSQYKTGVSLFVTPIVDVQDPPPTGQCANAKVYIADISGFGLLVYDLARGVSWRIQNKLMFPDPHYGTFTIAGQSFDLMDGILGMSLTPKSVSGERYLYFHALASGTENAVSLRLLNNHTVWDHDVEAEPRSFVEIGTRNTQSAAEAMDSKGNLFFGLMDPIAIASWNIMTPYTTSNIKVVAQNDETLQFASGVKVKRFHNIEELWVLTCRFQRVMTGTKNSQEINFRIQKCGVDNLLNNRSCTSRNSHTDNLVFV